MPAALCLTTFCSNVICSTWHHGQRPSWLRTVNRTAYPDCPPCQLYWNVLRATVTRRAFLNSIRFLTTHFSDRHAVCFAKSLSVIVISLGTRFGTDGSAPPNIRFSAAASR